MLISSGKSTISTMNSELELQIGTRDAATLDLLSRPRVARWIQHALTPAVRAHALTIRVVGQAEGRLLNRQFRGKDYATNVLTFDYTREPVLSADIVLCAPVVKHEAREQGKALHDHWAHLIIHGVLHAQGYDHEASESDAFEMEALEILLLGALNIASPY